MTTVSSSKAKVTARGLLGASLVALLAIVLIAIVIVLASTPMASVAGLVVTGAAVVVSCVRGWKSLFVRAPRARKRAHGYSVSEQEGAGGHLLKPGPVVLRGRVAYADGATEAMRVDLVERGREAQGKYGWNFWWTEESRHLTARPFYLVRDGGPRIRVEAEARSSQLFDTLEKQITPLSGGDEPTRQRVAKLDREEEVWVVGELLEGDDPEATRADAQATDGSDYRQNARPTGWILRAAPALVVSSVSLVDHFTARAKLHRKQGLLALVSLLLPLFMVARFADRIHGHATQGTVTGVLDVRSGKTNVHEGYRAIVAIDGAEWQAEEVQEEPIFGAPYVLRLGRYSSNDGADFHATTGEFVSSLVFLLAIVAAAAIARVNALRSLPWFRSVGSFVETGKGRLER